MTRTILLLLAGAACGAAAVHTLAPPRVPSLASMQPLPADGRDAAPGATEGGSPGNGGADKLPGTAERLALYRTAAEAGERELRALIAEAAKLPSAAAHRFTLDALLTRYAELDARAAALYAEELELDAALLAPVYRAWAAVDQEAALRGLTTIDDPPTARAVALALVDVVGADDAALARLAEALPGTDAAAFRADALAAQAATAPAAALEQALGLADPQAARLAVQRVGAAWARTDPRAALRRLEVIRDPRLRDTFEGAVLGAWAETEPVGMLEHVADSGTRIDERNPFRPPLLLGSVLFESVARADPIRVLDLAPRLPRPLAGIARQIALQSLAGSDPVRALAYAESTPAGPERQQAMQLIAAGYGRRDPDAALEWARSLEPRMPGVLASTLSGVALVDADRALDAALAETAPMSRIRAAQSVVMAVTSSAPERVEALADRLLSELGGREAPQALDMLTSMWASSDPETALSWLLANGDRVGTNGFRSVAQQLGHQNPELAARYAQQVPAAVRPDWIATVAQGYAQQAPTEAAAWVGQFRGEPGYDAAVAAVVQSSAHYDPPAAARLLDDIDTSTQAAAMAAMSVAHQWTMQDPAAAADWAARLDGQARSMAVRGVAQVWATQDRYNARSWALGLAAGPVRDEALTAVLGSIASLENTADSALLDAFSSDAARQRALLAVVLPTAQRDAAAARALIDEHITDPALRQQAERMLAANPNAVDRLSFSSSQAIAVGPGMPPPFRP